jgi:hypothetical protein
MSDFEGPIFAVGEMLEIRSGTFAGMSGSALASDGSDGVVHLELSIFGRVIPIQLSASRVCGPPLGEPEWLACRNTARLVSFLCHHDPPLPLRKMRLFACACLGLIREQFAERKLHKGLALAEQLAEGRLGPGAGLQVALRLRGKVGDRPRGLPAAPLSTAEMRRLAVAAALASDHAVADAWPWVARLLPADAPVSPGLLLRDIAGNPFRPFEPDPAWLTFQGGLIRRLAHDIYNEQRFAEMPVLGDVLEDAGCRNQAVLDHCRSTGPHVRGCWLLDSLLGQN